jgi:long-chain acyl-CoA synthetase
MSNGIFLFNMPEKTLFALPAHHTFGSTVNLIGHYMQGLEIYISSGNRYILEELKKEDPTHLVLVPLYIETFYKKIFASIEKQGKLPLVKKMMKISDALRKCGIDLREKLFGEILKNFGSRMRLIVSGGAALNPDIIRDFESIGIVILNGYGITECAPLISCNRNNYRKAGSVGRPIIYEDVRIYNPDENGEGEICVKGTNVMLGYYENDEATREVFDEDGYFHTGDLGKIDDEGWIYITGRSKNLIILSNGKNVYPEEIETELSRIYGISEVIVYEGLSRDGAATDLIVAEIFPDREALALRNITDEKKYFDTEVAALNARSAPHKKIGLVKIREVEFEKTTTRKITRFSIDKTVD